MKKVISVLVILCLALTVFTACAPKPEKAIVGTWKGQVTLLGVSSNVEYTFNENGSGVMTSAIGVGIAMNYTIDETSLTVTTDTPLLQKTYTYTYAFDSDTLTLTDSDGTMTLTKETAK